MPQLPPMTKAFMLACTVMFCVQALLGPFVDVLLALWPIGSGRFLPWQVLTYAFLHGGIAHLVFNMLGMWMFGAELERVWGGRRFVQFCLASALMAAVAQLLVMSFLVPGAKTLGASGVLFGLLLAYALEFPRRQFDLVGFLPVILLMVPFEPLNILGLILYVVMLTNRNAVPLPPIPVAAKVLVTLYGGLELLQGVFGSQAGVAHFAHLGGMLGGWLMFRYWRGQPPFPPKKRRF